MKIECKGCHWYYPRPKWNAGDKLEWGFCGAKAPRYDNPPSVPEDFKCSQFLDKNNPKP